MQKKANLIQRDQYALKILVREIASLIHSFKHNEWGATKLILESGPEALDDIKEHRVHQNGELTRQWQIKRQTTTLNGTHITGIIKALLADSMMEGVLVVKDNVEVEDDGKRIEELRVLQELSLRSRKDGIQVDAFFSNVNNKEKKWLEYFQQQLSEGSSQANTLAILQRLSIEFAGTEEEIKQSALKTFASIYEKPEDVWNTIYSKVSQDVDPAIEYTYETITALIKNHPHKSNVSLPLERIRIKLENSGAAQIFSSIPIEELIKNTWGTTQTTTPINKSSLVIYYPYQPDDNVEITSAILRLSNHGGVGRINVVNADKWKSLASNIMNDCFGVQAPAHPIWREMHDECVIREHTGQCIRTWVQVDTTAAKLAADLSERMNAWVWENLNYNLEDILKHSASHLGYEIEKNLRHEMLTLWQKWRAKCESDIELQNKYLLTCLTTVAEQKEFPTAGDIRLGPLVVHKCLLEASIFVLALVTALQLNGEPAAKFPHANINIIVDDDSLLCHLVGLERIKKKFVFLALKDILSAEINLPLLTHCQEDIFRMIPSLAGETTSYRALNADSPSFRSERPLTTMPVPYGNLFKLKMKEGKDPLKTYLQEMLNEGVQDQIAGAKNIINH